MSKLGFAILFALIPTLLLAQSSDPVEGDWRKAMIGVFGAIVPYAQGRIVVVLLDWIKKTYAWLDGQSSWVKELSVIILNGIPIFLGSYLGIPGLVGLDQWDYAIAGTVLSSAISFGVKAGSKSKVLEKQIEQINVSKE